MNYKDAAISIVRVDDKLMFQSSPIIEEITKSDIKELLKDVYRNKPKQFPLGMYIIRYCDICLQEYVLYYKQQFCPICHLPIEISTEHTDANFKYDTLIKKWVEEKNFLENILYNNMPFEVYDDGSGDDLDPIPITESEIFNREPLVEDL